MQKPARSPAFFFPCRPATVTQTWLLFAQALTGKHINTISCSTGSNPHTCAKNTNVCTHTHAHEPIHAASSKCSVWHQIRSQSIGSLQSTCHGQSTDGFRRRQQKVVLTLTLCLCHNQSSSACVLFHVRFTHGADIAQIYSYLCFRLVLLVLSL